MTYIKIYKKYSLKKKDKKDCNQKIYLLRNEKVENNKISLIIKVDEEDIKKEIYFLCNDKLENNNIKKLNDSNTELYINGAKHNFERHFIPIQKREYTIDQFIHSLRKRLELESYDALFLLANCKKEKAALVGSMTFGDVYEKYKDDDVFLYLIYANEKVWG